MACLCICARGENSPTRKCNTLTPNLLPSTTNMPSHTHSGLSKPHANRTPVLLNNHNSYMPMQRQLPNCTLQLATTRQHLMLLCCPVCRCSARWVKASKRAGVPHRGVATPPQPQHATANHTQRALHTICLRLALLVSSPACPLVSRSLQGQSPPAPNKHTVQYQCFCSLSILIRPKQRYKITGPLCGQHLHMPKRSGVDLHAILHILLTHRALALLGLNNVLTAVLAQHHVTAGHQHS